MKPIYYNLLTSILVGCFTTIQAQVTIRGNVYGGGEAAQVVGNTTVEVNTSFADADEIEQKFTDNVNPKYSVFGGGWGEPAVVHGTTNVKIQVPEYSGFEAYNANADAYTDHPFGVKGFAIPNVIGGGFNGAVEGNTNVTLTGTSYVGHLYGGGMYADVKSTNVLVKSGVVDYAYGGGLIGGVTGVAAMTIGNTDGIPADDAAANKRVVIRHNVFGANDVSGSVHAVDLQLRGGIVFENVYGAGDGNHFGYYDATEVKYKSGLKQDTYTTEVLYSSRPQTTEVDLALGGNTAEDRMIVKGNVFGGGNSCSIGFSLEVALASHLTIGHDYTKEERATNIGGLFMGSSGEYLVNIDNDKYETGAFSDQTSFEAYVDNIKMSGKATLSMADDVEDIEISSFIGGGFHGSMAAPTDADPATWAYDYSLARGVTILDRVVGGSYDAYAKYTDGSKSYEVDGGFLNGQNGQKQLRLTLRNRLMPHLDENKTHAYGANVFGGCYSTGLMTGDVLLDYQCWVDDAADFTKYDDNLYALASDAEANNCLTVVGCGYGADTHSQGNHSVIVNNKPYQIGTNDVFASQNVFNVFGGSQLGTTEGNTYVKFDGYLDANNKPATVFGNIYGGGMQGNLINSASASVEVTGGYVTNVYGGARQANIAGGTYVWIHEPYLADGSLPDRHVPTVAKMVCGGTDVAGTIDGANSDSYIANKNWLSVDTDPLLKKLITEAGSDWRKTPNTYVRIGDFAELEKHNSSDLENDKAKAGYNSYPLIGTVYAGGNGELWTAEDGDQPNVGRAVLDIAGGTMFQAYGGGNMATITEKNYIHVAEPIIPSDGNHGSNDVNDPQAKYNVIASVAATDKEYVNNHFIGVQDQDYKKDGNQYKFNYQVLRLFGGNNHAKMSILPSWNLVSGHLGHVYSGGNMGDMNYFNGNRDLVTVGGSAGDKFAQYSETRGLNLTVNSEQLYVDQIFGGCRIASVEAKDGDNNTVDFADRYPDHASASSENDIDFDKDVYGATLRVLNGHFNDVYGGNDIAGRIYNGTHLFIAGAISGNVYGAGNGNYVYKYAIDDQTGQIVTQVKEVYDPNLYGEENGGYYYILPQCPEYALNVAGLADHNGYKTVGFDQDMTKIMGINMMRPNVTKAYLDIEGRPHDLSTVYISNAVYCGGNSATITQITPGDTHQTFTRFKMGDCVTLNAVYMGSNGENLTSKRHLNAVEKVNNMNLTAATNTSANLAQLYKSGGEYKDNEKLIAENLDEIYPALLDIYMRAVEMDALPQGFNNMKDVDYTAAYIGDFCLGGNAGSMMIDKKVKITFPYKLNVFGNIIGGCKNTNFTYVNEHSEKAFGVKHIGGFMMPLSDTTDGLALANDKSNANTVKTEMEIQCQFVNLRMNLASTDANDLFRKNKLETNLVDGHLGDGCNVYGGCYESGITVGDVHIDLYSDMLARSQRSTHFEKYTYKTWDAFQQELDKMLTLGDDVVTAYKIYGAGYGEDSRVLGDTHIHTIPWSSTTYASTRGGEHPTAVSVYGGGQQGIIVGNSEIRIQDGLIYKDVVGGTDQSDFYGSTSIIVGFPEYYICKQAGTFQLKRGDHWTVEDGKRMKTVKIDDQNVGMPAVVSMVSYRVGDYVPKNVVSQIIGHSNSVVDTHGQWTTWSDNGTSTWKDYHNNETSFDHVADVSSFFDLVNEQTKTAPYNKLDHDKIFPGWGLNDDGKTKKVDIQIGGGVYGGGYSVPSNLGNVTGEPTVHKFATTAPDRFGHKVFRDLSYRKHTALDPVALVGYGGNSSIMLADDNSESEGKDHIRVSSLHEEEVHLKAGKNKMGYFAKDPSRKDSWGTPAYETLQDHEITADEVNNTKNIVYKVTGEGGIFGDGHFVYCEGFRAADLTGYGYHEGTVKYPVLLNTFQRLDLVDINDCCFFLEGQRDYATVIPNATIYSVALVNEWRMNSSINKTSDLAQISMPDVIMTGGAEGKNGEAFDQTQKRNYVGFYNNVHFLGAIVSNDAFNDPYHNKSGKYQGTPDPTLSLGTTASYEQVKKGYIDKFYDAQYNASTDELKAENADNFKKRNLGTGRNLVGLNNGYTLRIQNEQDGVRTAHNGGSSLDYYYGPVVGVFEVKLLTATQGEGGGYIYAANHHEAKTTASGTDLADAKKDDHYFLETSGNFMFPGTCFNGQAPQYVVDDCYPTNFHPTYSSGSITKSEDQALLESMNPAACHYWYLQGSKYFYNVVLTCYTMDYNQKFLLNQAEQAVILDGIVKDQSKVHLESVKWLDHGMPETAPSGYKSDLMGVHGDTNVEYASSLEGNFKTDPKTGIDRKKYEMFVYIGENASENAETRNMDWGKTWNTTVSRPVVNITSDLEDDSNIWEYSDIKDASTYAAYQSETSSGLPVLGIRLNDRANNNPSLTDPSQYLGWTDQEKKDYYKNFMSEDTQVKMLLKAQNPGATEEYEYTINLTIEYLHGPTVMGAPRIENCALPGEIIRVNTSTITVEGDDGMPIKNKQWRLLPPADGPNGSNLVHAENGYIVDKYKVTYRDGNEKLELPASYYLNKWGLAFRFQAGESTFDVLSTDGGKEPITTIDVHNYHNMTQVWNMREQKEPLSAPEFMGALPSQDPIDINLQPVKGARIYIETADDMINFLNYATWIKGDEANQELNGIHGDGWTDIYGHPTNAEGLEFYLMDNIDLSNKTMPPSYDLSSFKGKFHGMGHTLTLPASNNFELPNGNKPYNLIVRHAGESLTDTDKNGGRAYDGNNYYLHKRYHVGNNSDALAENDHAEKGYVEDYFRNGDYQYATFNTEGTDEGKHLRNNRMPHYRKEFYESYADHDFYYQLTNHHVDIDYATQKYEHDKDMLRYDELSKTYIPLFNKVLEDPLDAEKKEVINDYIFFGQNLTAENPSTKPNAIYRSDYLYGGSYGGSIKPVGEERVYRAEAFNHSKNKYDVFFNEEGAVVDDKVTAVSFLPGSEGYQYGTNGNYYFAPQIDMPYFGLKSYTPAKNVTRNLLVYTLNSDEVAPSASPWPALPSGTNNAYSLVKKGLYGDYTNESEISYAEFKGHHITGTSTADGSIDYLHLIDYSNLLTENEKISAISDDRREQLGLLSCFNAPYAFSVGTKVWYERLPQYFRNVNSSDYGNPTAWEGICLPFTATKVTATKNGEISHFYGNNAIETIGEVDYDVSELHHEYWLNGFTKMEDTSTAFFARPVMSNTTSEVLFAQANGGAYNYPENTYFTSLERYNVDYNTRNPELEWYKSGHTFADYPYLTAGVPYIISFPGNDFYEFSLEGTKYELASHTKTGAAQTITFESNAVTIGVTDDETRTTTVNGQDHVGTYMTMVNADSSNKGVYGMNATGSAFETGRVALPFRTYMKGAGAVQTRSILIMDPYLADLMEEQSEEPEDELGEDYLKIWAEGRDIVIKTSEARSFTLYRYDGTYMGMLNCQSGINRFSQENEGIYLVGREKLLLR